MKYGFRVYQVEIEDESFWFAESTDLKGCAGQGKTCDEAIKELEENEEIGLQMAIEDGTGIPKAAVEKPLNYSGKFTIRLSKNMHKKAAECAEKEGISLNAFVTEAISEKVGGFICNPTLSRLEKVLDKFSNVVHDSAGAIRATIAYNEKIAQSSLLYLGQYPGLKLNYNS